MSGHLLVLTPTRGRPRRFAEMVQAVRQTTDGRVRVLGLVDGDDPHLDAYTRAIQDVPANLMVGQRRSLSGWTNYAAQLVASREDRPAYLASLGDDHRPSTPDWDRRLVGAIEALDGPGWAYGDDLLQRAQLPTAWVQSIELVDSLGWMMLPACEHMYVDTAILRLGQRTGRLTYCPDVVIEHQHPYAGVVPWDESYLDSNSPGQFSRDCRAFQHWAATGLDADAAKVRSLRHEHAHKMISDSGRT